MLNVLEIYEVRHSHIPGWLEFELKVRWPDGRIEDIPFTYNPNDDAPLTVGLRDHIIPNLDPNTILPVKEASVG